jgi:hypothetical protein
MNRSSPVPSLLVLSARVEDLLRLLQRGPADPALGLFFETGTCTSLIDCTGADLEACKSEIVQAARGFDVPTRMMLTWDQLASQLVPAGTLVHVAGCPQLESDDRASEALQAARGTESSLLLLLRERDSDMAAMALLTGPSIPALGVLPASARCDLVATCLAMYGRTASTGRDLLEHTEADHSVSDRDLTERLRQLYGADH